MDRSLTLLSATLGLALSLTATPAAIAQEATPPVGEYIDASECQIGPRAIEDIEQLIGTPTADGAEATPDVTEIGPLTGEAADQETVEAVTTTYRELVACLNAGDYLRIYALYTDDYVQRTLAERGEELEQLLATPSPREEQQTALVSVRDVRLVEGDRVAARVETFDPTVGGTIIIDALLVPSGDRYLIDAETVVDAPTLGTPEAEEVEAGGAAAITVESYDIYFEPAEFSIPADTDVTVTLPNEGVTLHNFAIDVLGIDVDIAPGSTEETVINAPAGVYEYYCNVPGHKQAGMVGTLTVE
ncbi:MAG: cupredoxin domain-containing protein [Chloroflexi bacterium]|nr:cupredoxin domain-containing protein [Chloroflexota bacterium]